MKWRFEEDEASQEMSILVTKDRFDAEVETVIAILEQLQSGQKEVIALKTQDRVQLLKVKDLITVEVDGNDLVITTVKGVLRTQGRLYRLKEQLAHPDIIQVSKYCLINIHHLDYLENSFSGNMMAFLTGNVKTSVSRRFLKDLEKRLGIR